MRGHAEVKGPEAAAAAPAAGDAAVTDFLEPGGEYAKATQRAEQRVAAGKAIADQAGPRRGSGGPTSNTDLERVLRPKSNARAGRSEGVPARIAAWHGALRCRAALRRSATTS